MVIISCQDTQTGTVRAATYYTILRQRLIGIAFRYNNREIDSNEVMQAIESTSYDTTQIELAERQALTRTIIAYIIIVIIIIIFVISKRKNFPKKLQQIKEKEKEEYKKLGGLFAVFIVTLGLILLNAMTTFQTIAELEPKELKLILYFQNGLLIIPIIYIFFLLIKKRELSTPKKMEKAIILIGMINILGSIARICYFLGNANLMNPIQYYLQESIFILANFAYMSLWSTYFVVSKRIHIYYQIPIQYKK